MRESAGPNRRPCTTRDLLSCLPFFARVIRQKDSAVKTDHHALISAERNIGYVVEGWAGDLLPLPADRLGESAAAGAGHPELLGRRVDREGIRSHLIR